MRVIDREGRIKLAGYMIRAPMSLEKMTYDAATGTVIYRSKMHAGLKRNFQVMPGAQWLELLCKHLPDRHEHLVRYVELQIAEPGDRQVRRYYAHFLQRRRGGETPPALN